MLRTVLMIVACTTVHAHAAPFCPTPSKSEGEGAIPIPESAFTEQAARRELNKLQTLLGPDGLTVDAVAWETSFVYLEGWYLKRQALVPKENRPPQAIPDFCDFMRERAYVHH